MVWIDFQLDNFYLFSFYHYFCEKYLMYLFFYFTYFFCYTLSETWYCSYFEYIFICLISFLPLCIIFGHLFWALDGLSGVFHPSYLLRSDTVPEPLETKRSPQGTQWPVLCVNCSTCFSKTQLDSHICNSDLHFEVLILFIFAWGFVFYSCCFIGSLPEKSSVPKWVNYPDNFGFHIFVSLCHT